MMLCRVVVRSSRSDAGSPVKCCVVSRSSRSDAGSPVGGADVVLDLHLQLGQQHVHHGHLETVPAEGLAARTHVRGKGMYGATMESELHVIYDMTHDSYVFWIPLVLNAQSIA